MDFKIQQTYPQVTHGISSYNTLCYAENISSLILYGEQTPAISCSSQQPKKKIAFKATKSQVSSTTDKISVFSLQSLKWEIKQCKGKVPAIRRQFSSVQVGPCMLIYGGFRAQKQFNDIYALNTDTWTWKKLFSIQNPSTCHTHILCKLNQSSLCLIASGNLWILHIDDVKWQLSSNQLPGSVWEKTNIQLPNNPVCCVKISDEEILVFGEKKYHKINYCQKNNVGEFEFGFDTFFQLGAHSKVEAHSLIHKNGDCAIILGYGNRLLLFNYQTHQNMEMNVMNFSDNLQKILDFPVHCRALVSSCDEKILFIMDPKGQLYSISYSMIFDTQQQSSEIPETTRIIQSPIGKRNDVITEQQYGDDETSSLLIPDSSHQLKQSNSIKQSNDNYSDKQHHIKLNSEVDVRVSSQMPHNQSYMQQPGILKQKLSVILTHQHLKRRLLQQKCKNLEQVIKKSEKFVLLLCKFGNKNGKKQHIGQVKSIRQDLEQCVSRQAYYRKQMSGNKIPVNISRAVEHTIRGLKI